MKFLKSSRGNSEIPIILVVIVGAFFLAGGQYIFQGLTSPDNTNPAPAVGGGNGGNGGNSETTAWKVTTRQISCDSSVHKASVEIGLFGPNTGYYTVSVKKNNNYAPIYSHAYTNTPNQADTGDLANSDGFNLNPWRVELFDGGGKSGNTFSGGDPVATSEAQPTACP